MQLLLATSNPNKLKEFQAILKNIDFILPDKLIDVPETGVTFCANALLKAKAYAKAGGGLMTLADDSGLCIDSLDGKPGVNSHRFAAAGFPAARKKILKLLANVPESRRTARFICCLAFYDPRIKQLKTFTGKAEGWISQKEIGIDGFGYDSIFIPHGYKLTFGQMPTRQKNRLSHRFQALTKLRLYLISLPKLTPPKPFLVNP